MNSTAKRLISIALCAFTLLGVSGAALADIGVGNIQAGTPVYNGASTAQQLGTFSAGGQANIISESGEFYFVSAGGVSGYVLKTAVNMTPVTPAAATGTTADPTAATGTPGYITGVKTDANMRAEASAKSSKVGVVTKNEVVSILGVEGEFTKITSSSGVTGYVLSKYVASGTPAAPAASGGTSVADAADVALESPIQMVSVAKTIYMRKTPTSSTKSANLVKKLTSVKGKVFTVIASNGSEWFKATYDGYTGYVKSTDLATATTTQLTYATGDKSKDKWGEVVKIDGTNIGSAYGQLYDNNIYCNGMNSKGTDYYYNAYSGKKNYFYMLSPQNAPIHVLMTHNMRSSLTGGHYLHHIQNAFLGVAKCESCKKACTAQTATFQISYANHTNWQLIGFYEGNTSMRNYGAVNYGLTGAQKQGWITQILSYCTGTYKGKVLGSATDADDVMIIITCGDKGSKSGAFLCMLLKGI